MVQCSGCKEWKHQGDFYFRKDIGRFRHDCKECVKTKASVYRDNYKKEIRAARLVSKYGITQEDYDSMLLDQEGMCAICGTKNPQGRHNIFVVDHDHTTGDVRGLLCHNCNTGLGKLGDTISGLERAIRYLKEEYE